MNKQQIAIILIGVLSIILVVVGFIVMGDPASQKLIRFDEKRLSDFSNIRYEVEGYYSKNKTLPDSLSQLPNIKSTTDPETQKLYQYEKASNRIYRLCTTFSNDYENFKKLGGNQYYFGSEQQVTFGKGYSCLELVLPEYVINEKRILETPVAPQAAPF